MSTDHMILGGAALAFVLALVYAVKSRKAPSAMAAIRSVATSLQPVAAPVEASSAKLFADAMTAIEKDGVKKAVDRIVDQFAESHAADYKARVQGIVAPKADPPPPTAAQTSPAA